MDTIRELTSIDDQRAALAAYQALYPDLTEEVLLATFDRLTPQGYRAFGLLRGDEVLAVAGVHPIDLFKVGRALWLFDMATRTDQQGMGYGSQLLNFLKDYASQNGYARLLLHTAANRHETIKFYEKNLGEPFGVVFRSITNAV